MQEAASEAPTFVITSSVDCTEVEYATEYYSESPPKKSPASKKRLYDELQRDVEALSPSDSGMSDGMSDQEYLLWHSGNAGKVPPVVTGRAHVAHGIHYFPPAAAAALMTLSCFAANAIFARAAASLGHATAIVLDAGTCIPRCRALPAAPSARSGIPIKHISEDEDDGPPPLVREEGVFTDRSAVALERMERRGRAVPPKAVPPIPKS